MKVNNIGKLFYKDYYKEVDFNEVISGRESNLGDINERIKGSTLLKIPNPIDIEACSFEATIQYPGLITGVGLEHNSKNIKGGYNLGMHFDYTYGMPVVYGSSVKGVLRTYFKDFFLRKYTNTDRVNDVNLLSDLIFKGENPKYGKEKDEPKNISLYERDIFFDAVIVETYKGKFLEDDYITPHPDPLKNPTPIKMLKIAPGCKIEFRFRLKESDIDGRKFGVEEKLELFQEILETVGVGAKTNVGYGQLEIES